MARTPSAEDAHGLDELFAGAGERVGDLGWRSVFDLATNNAVGFELAQLCSEDFFADTWEQIAKLREALGAKAEMPDDEDLPFAAHAVNGSLHRAAIVIF